MCLQDSSDLTQSLLRLQGVHFRRKEIFFSQILFFLLAMYKWTRWNRKKQHNAAALQKNIRCICQEKRLFSFLRWPYVEGRGPQRNDIVLPPEGAWTITHNGRLYKPTTLQQLYRERRQFVKNEDSSWLKPEGLQLCTRRPETVSNLSKEEACCFRRSWITTTI